MLRNHIAQMPVSFWYSSSHVTKPLAATQVKGLGFNSLVQAMAKTHTHLF